MPLDPVEQTLEQGRTQRSGGGGSEGVGGFVQMALARRNMQQRQVEHADEVNLANQRLDIERRQQVNRDQQAREEGLLAPLMREYQTAINKKTGATAQGAVLDEQLKADQMAGLNGLTALELRAARSPLGVLDPELRADTDTLFLQHPGLTLMEAGARYLANMQRARKTKEFTATFGQPESASVTDPETGTTLRFGERPTLQMRNAQELAKQDTIINDPNATPEAKGAAQAAKKYLQQQVKDNTKPSTPLGKLLDERQQQLANGNVEAAAVYDKAINAIALGKQFAPSDLAKKMNEYQQALLDGNETVIHFYEDKLGIAGMNAETRALYKAGLQAINNDPTIYKAEDKQKKQEAFTASFFKMHGLTDKQSPKADNRVPVPVAGETQDIKTLPKTFTKGERRTQNGHTFEFDGSKWNRVP